MLWFHCAVVLLVVIATGVDLWRREIPNSVPLVILAMIPLAHVLATWAVPWWSHVIGCLVALVAAMVIGWGDRFGGGDVKLFAALGGWFGLTAVLPLAIWTAIAGLPLALLAAWRGKEDMAYGPAILGGLCVHLAFPQLLWRIAGLV